jgi:hypothetical protein
MPQKRFFEFDDASAVAGSDKLLVSQPSSTVTYTASTLSAAASDNSLNDSANQFIAEGFTVGKTIRISGFTGAAGNNEFARVLTVAAGKITLGGITLVDDAAGESVTLTQWDTKTATPSQFPAPTAAQDAVALTISSGAVNIDCALSDYFTLTLTANVTSITFTNLPGSGKAATKWVEIVQGAGPYTVAWPASFKWANGSAGAVSTADGAVDELAITTLNNGTAWKATLAKAFA